jgi:hypothetical protein
MGGLNLNWCGGQRTQHPRLTSSPELSESTTMASSHPTWWNYIWYSMIEPCDYRRPAAPHYKLTVELGPAGTPGMTWCNTLPLQNFDGGDWDFSVREFDMASCVEGQGVDTVKLVALERVETAIPTRTDLATEISALGYEMEGLAEGSEELARVMERHAELVAQYARGDYAEDEEERAEDYWIMDRAAAAVEACHDV